MNFDFIAPYPNITQYWLQRVYKDGVVNISVIDVFKFSILTESRIILTSIKLPVAHPVSNQKRYMITFAPIAHCEVKNKNKAGNPGRWLQHIPSPVCARGKFTVNDFCVFYRIIIWNCISNCSPGCNISNCQTRYHGAIYIGDRLTDRKLIYWGLPICHLQLIVVAGCTLKSRVAARFLKKKRPVRHPV